MSDKLNKYPGFWNKFFRAMGFKQPKPELETRKDWMGLPQGGYTGQYSILVHYSYHRYFWKAKNGDGIAHCMYDIHLN